MKRWNISWDAMLVMSMVLVAGVCSQAQQSALAQEEAKQERVVSISPDAKGDLPLETEEGEPAAPAYWIGIQGRGVQSPVLRTHLQLAEDMGVVIESVVPDSPAKKAGLQKYDIILRANGEAVHNMVVLQQHVLEHQAKPIELKLIRLGQEETVVVVPEERPQEFESVKKFPLQGRSRRFNFGGGGADGALGGANSDALRNLMEQLLANEGLQGGVRMFGPGMLLEGNPQGQQEMPDGVSYSITRKSGEPTKIVIRRGEESWEIVGDDAEALARLPEDLQPLCSSKRCSKAQVEAITRYATST